MYEGNFLGFSTKSVIFFSTKSFKSYFRPMASCLYELQHPKLLCPASPNIPRYQLTNYQWILRDCLSWPPQGQIWTYCTSVRSPPLKSIDSVQSSQSSINTLQHFRVHSLTLRSGVNDAPLFMLRRFPLPWFASFRQRGMKSNWSIREGVEECGLPCSLKDAAAKISVICVEYSTRRHYFWSHSSSGIYPTLN